MSTNWQNYAFIFIPTSAQTWEHEGSIGITFYPNTSCHRKFDWAGPSLHCQLAWQIWSFGTRHHTHTQKKISHHKLLPTDQDEILTCTHIPPPDMIMENWSHWGRRISSWAGKNQRQTDGQTEFSFPGGWHYVSFCFCLTHEEVKGKKINKYRSWNGSNPLLSNLFTQVNALVSD